MKDWTGQSRRRRICDSEARTLGTLPSLGPYCRTEKRPARREMSRWDGAL